MSEKDFVKFWVNKIISGKIKIFPADFIDGEECVPVTMPAKALVIGKDFFGSYEVTTVEGESFRLTNNYEEAKYIIYANRDKPSFIMMPIEKEHLEIVNCRYEDYLAQFILKIDEDYKKKFEGESNFHSIMNDIFRKLNVIKY
jgi:hypothetical protein